MTGKHIEGTFLDLYDLNQILPNIAVVQNAKPQNYLEFFSCIAQYFVSVLALASYHHLI